MIEAATVLHLLLEIRKRKQESKKNPVQEVMNPCNVSVKKTGCGGCMILEGC